MTGSQPMRRAINALYHNYKFVLVGSYASPGCLVSRTRTGYGAGESE